MAGSPPLVMNILNDDSQNPDVVQVYLGNFLGSAVNPVFRKLHGWIEDRLLDYLRLHPEVCFTDSVRGVEAVPVGYPRCSKECAGSQNNTSMPRDHDYLDTTSLSSIRSKTISLTVVLPFLSSDAVMA